MTIRIAALMPALALAAGAFAATARVDGIEGGAVPPAVLVAEGLAEDVQADLDARNWVAVREKVAQLDKNRSELRAAVNTSKLASYGSALDSLNAQVRRQNRPAALQSANRMSRSILTIMADYDVIVPLRVGLMDVAGRDAIYGAADGRWQNASAAAGELHANYAVVQSHVAAKDPTLDQRVRRQIAELDAAVGVKDATRVAVIATSVLEDVDLIEQTY